MVWGSLYHSQDVAKEQERVAKGDADSEMLVVRDLVKIYPAKGRKGKPLAAVRGVSIGIKPQECFGLLVCSLSGNDDAHHIKYMRVRTLVEIFLFKKKGWFLGFPFPST